MIPSNFFKRNLDYIPKQVNLYGDEVEDRSMMGRLGFLPSSIWEPSIAIVKELKEVINDTAQTRELEQKRNSFDGKASVFNPHLAQMILAAYCLPNARIYDPFGGGGTRGYVAAKMGHRYLGVEIRENEVNRINEEMSRWKLTFELIAADSRYYQPDGKYDFSFTCPPYYDLEVYSNQEGDLSNLLTYGDFLTELEKVVTRVFNCLKEGAFSVWVVGNFRNKTGALEHLNGDLIKIAKKVGFIMWDELIWKGASSVALTRSGLFESNRKSVRMHEYILIFKKAKNGV